MNWLGKIAVNTISILIAEYLLSGVHVDDLFTGFVVAIVLAILGPVLKPVLIVLTLPITFVTFGVFLFFINALVLLIADWAVDGFTVDGFWWAVLLSFILSLLNSLFLPKEKKPDNSNWERLD